MKPEVSLSHLTAQACYCHHEDGWVGEPITEDTARRIDAFIRNCPRALGGLNIGCAHYYMQDIKGVDWLFANQLRGHAKKERLKKTYTTLHNLKRYLDQLTRLGKGISLEDLESPEYIDDPRLAASIFDLPEEDELRQLFESAKSCTDVIQQARLFHQIDDMIIVRMNSFLDEVRMIFQN